MYNIKPNIMNKDRLKIVIVGKAMSGKTTMALVLQSILPYPVTYTNSEDSKASLTNKLKHSSKILEGVDIEIVERTASRTPTKEESVASILPPYLDKTKKEIIEAYTFLRTHNQSIPIDTLEFMKDSSLNALNVNSDYPKISSMKFHSWLTHNGYVCVSSAHDLKEEDQKFIQTSSPNVRSGFYYKSTLYQHYTNLLALKPKSDG